MKRITPMFAAWTVFIIAFVAACFSQGINYGSILFALIGIVFYLAMTRIWFRR